MTVRFELVGVPMPGRAPYRWAFGEPECPLRLASTPTGLGGAPLKHLRQSNARQAGATWRGRVDDINTITLNVQVGPVEPGAPALALWHAWRESLGRGDEVGELHAHGPHGRRWQYVRLEKEMPDPDFASLEWNGWVNETATLTSDFSFWQGQEVKKFWTPEAFDTATMKNGGDIESFLHYELHGPGTFTVGTADEYHTLPAIPAGQSWHIETDRDNPYIRDRDGRDVWDSVGVKAWYEPVPKGETAQLRLSVTGAGPSTSATVTLPQLFARAT